MKTQAAVLYGTNRDFVIEDLFIQEPKEEEVLIEVKAAGLCHSDWNFVTGDSTYNLPVVLGHEGSGIVIKSGKNVSTVKEGDRILFNSGPNCGECYVCKNNHPSICETFSEANWNGVMLDGSTRLKNKSRKDVHQLASVGCFSQYIVLPEKWCVKILESTPFEIGAILSCAVITGIGAVLNTSSFKSGANAIVFGIGGVGSNVLIGLKYAKANKIIAVDINKDKRKLALALGATEFIEFDSESIQYILNLKKQFRVEYSYEAAGSVETQELSIDCLSPGGVATLIGIPPVKMKTRFFASILTRQEKTIKGSYYGTQNTAVELRKLEGLYKDGTIDLDSLITHRYSLKDIQIGYKNLLEGKHARGVILF